MNFCVLGANILYPARGHRILVWRHGEKWIEVTGAVLYENWILEKVSSILIPRAVGCCSRVVFTTTG